MQLSTRTRYAVMAMAELAARDTADTVTLAQIAQCQQLSQCYLEQLFGALRRAGLVVSVRGPGGGYRLARPPERVCIADILKAVEEPVCCAGDGARVCRTHDLWNELGRQIDLFLGGVTLEDVVAGRVRGRAVEPQDA